MSDSTPREKLVRQSLNVLCNTANFPPQAQPELLGRNMRPTAEALADELIGRGWRPPARVVTTVEELDALPKGTVIRDALSVQECLGTWLSPHVPLWAGTAGELSSSSDLQLPATVLWESEEGER